ncbi:MAG: ABC transporter ATP-binding protein [Leptospirales bacterium]|nr:ABC transporter ATP-binding protein [Leptospirales bacterium]
MAVALEIENISVRLGGRDVLQGASLRVEERDFIALIGPNGGGKTTLLRAILGLAPLSQGAIRIFGAPPQRGRTSIGYLPQHFRFDADFPITALDVTLSGRLSSVHPFGRYSAEDRAAAREALAEVHLEGMEERRLDQLSGGQLQRVFVARALASAPRILLLDEPAAHLDPHVSGSLYELLQKLNERLTVVMTTHDVGAVSSYVKTVGCVNGALHYHGSHQLTHEMLHAAYAGAGPTDMLDHGLHSRSLH